MYNVIIVEDELLVRMGLKHSIDWNGHGMSVIGDFSDALSAYTFFKQNKVDIVITDIKMPGMDGIELIAKIREIDAGCGILIITCLDDIELARKAIQYDICGYLLKATMNEDEISRALTTARVRMDRIRQSAESADGRADGELPEELIREFIVHKEVNAEDFFKSIEKNPDLAPCRPRYVVIAGYDKSEEYRYLFKDGNKALHRSVRDMILKQFEDHLKILSAQISEDQLLIVICSKDIPYDDNSLRSDLIRIQKLICSYFNISITFVTHAAAGLWSRLPMEYDRCSELNDLRFAAGYNSIISENSLETIRKSVRERVTLFHTDFRILKNIRSSQADVYEKMLESIEKTPSCDSRMIKESLINLLFWLNGLLHLNATEKCTSAGFGIMKAGSLEEALCILSAFIDNEDMVYHQNALSRPEIRKTMDLIENEYTRYISLEEATSNAGLSPNYFSKLFKQESGSSFVKYLNRYRIEAAKRLLSETRLFIYEIAQKTGFSDETYFCRIFKKETGYNPSEWRQHNGG